MSGKFKVFIFMVAGFLGDMLGGWDNQLKTLVILMLLDYFTGTGVAWIYKKSKKSSHGGLSSYASFKGMFKKTIMLSMVLVAYLLDGITGLGMVRNFTIIGLIGTELISLKENWDCMDIKIPKVIIDTITKLNKKESGKYDNDTNR